MSVEKISLLVTKEVTAETIENIFITALEGGSNYWYYLSEDSIKEVRKLVPKSVDECLSTAIFKAVWQHGLNFPVYDLESYNDNRYEDTELLGIISMVTMAHRLQQLANNKDYCWALTNEMDDNGDASSSDVVFQFLVMGECVFS